MAEDVVQVTSWKQLCVSGLGLSPNGFIEDILKIFALGPNRGIQTQFKMTLMVSGIKNLVRNLGITGIKSRIIIPFFLNSVKHFVHIT